MADYISIENLKFLLNDVHTVSDLFEYDRYKDYDKETIDIFIDSISDWADKEFYPYFREMDEKPAIYEDGTIKVHPQVGKIMKDAGENGYIGLYFNAEDGGLQMPFLVSAASNHIVESANNHLPGYIGLTAGAAQLITSFGNDSLKEKYVPKMLAGEWAGTMALTEPQAGSSLSDIVTSASLNQDGSYDITGQKIFISGGDHEYCENFVHLTLARIEGAPAGTKGISLFVVPKNRITQEGGLEENDVITASDFPKMGQRGYCTTHLVYGENKNCKGWLVGEENKGLKYMFLMMNGARIDVGMTAASTATAAYYASLKYAKERPQGRKLTSDGTKNAKAEQAFIIEHPDVRRMLLLQKAITEASVSLLLESSKLHDISLADTGETAEDAHLLLELLTPMAKTYPSEMGRIAVSNGLQILGGYGFCTDFPLQQYARDIRIMSIYEGTTGIQSLDLMGRKITMKGGKALHLLTAKINETIEAAKTFDELKPYADRLTAGLKDITEVLTALMPYAMKGQFEKYLADATIFMEMAGTVVIAWQWLKMANKAKQALVTGNTEFGIDFYESKVHTMKFFYKYELTRIAGHKNILLHDDILTIKKEKELIS